MKGLKSKHSFVNSPNQFSIDLYFVSFYILALSTGFIFVNTALQLEGRWPRVRILKFYTDKLLVLNWLRLNSKWIFLQWVQVYYLNWIINSLTGATFERSLVSRGFSVAVPFLSISWFWRNLTEYRKHLPMVYAMVIKDKSRDLSQSETETLYYNKLKLFLLWMF